MKIMIFSNSEWDDTNAAGNTLSNFFNKKNWAEDDFYNIYIRGGKPNNNVCKNYYQLLLSDMIKNHFRKEKIGNFFIYDPKEDKEQAVNNERKIIDFIHNHSLNFTYLLADHIYRKRKWMNKKFKKYINDVNPDIFYAHVNNFSILAPIIEYVKNNTKAKIVVLLTDDLYNDIDNKSILRRKKMKNDFKNIINMSDKIYAISDELRKEYSIIFNKKIDILRKGCVFEYPVKKHVNEIIKFVYAGNLYYGRDDLLSKVAHAIEKSNSKNKRKALLEIYTGATITEELNKKLNIKDCSIIMGKKNYDEIKKIMNDADYNLQVESFEQKQIDYVKYSFSTKIIDCLQSGSAAIAIGPNNISSIKYMKQIPGVFVIDDVNKIDEKIQELINNNQIIKNSEMIRRYALVHHDVNKNQKKLKNDFLKIIKE